VFVIRKLLRIFTDGLFTDGQCPEPARRLREHMGSESRRVFRNSVSYSQSSCWFAILCCFIAAVSVHDAYLLLHYRQVMLENEKNPIGRWLIEVGGGDVKLFVAVKLTTTAVVCSFLVWMYQRHPRRTQYIATGVAAFQLGLLLYLMGAKR
jgi:hypothetical protein